MEVRRWHRAWPGRSARHCTARRLRTGGVSDKPITIVVPFAPGGTTDLAARLVGDLLQKTTGATVLIDNKVGAGGMQTRFRKIVETSNIKLTD